jgi:hypothetical protein
MKEIHTKLFGVGKNDTCSVSISQLDTLATLGKAQKFLY